MAETSENLEEVSKEQMALLEHYAAATKTKVVTSLADLDPRDTALEELLKWCRELKIIAVLRSETILSAVRTPSPVPRFNSLM